MQRILVGVLAIAAVSATAVFAQERDASLGFFITSAGVGNGGDLGGLSGADAHCQKLAAAVGHGDRVWRAYLSTSASDGAAAVNARDRIGAGPWYNAAGALVARDLAQLHSDVSPISKAVALDESGRSVNGRGDAPNQHDILTGSQADGTAFPEGDERSCSAWTSSAEGTAQVGHHDRQGGGEAPTSWNAAHRTVGCSQESLVRTGGNGYFYCFAAAGNVPPPLPNEE